MSHICKVLETNLRDNIVKHLKTHTLLFKSQHGFTKGTSCYYSWKMLLKQLMKASLWVWFILTLGSVLGPIPFFVFVSGIDTVISSHDQKFADACWVPTEEDIDIFQQDINNLCQWQTDWQMVFLMWKNVKWLQIGITMHIVTCVWIAKVYNLYSGIIVSNYLTMTLGKIKHLIVLRDKNTIVKLYKGLVRPTLNIAYKHGIRH